MIDITDITPPPPIIEFAKQNQVKNIRKVVEWSEPFAFESYKNYNEVYRGQKGLRKHIVIILVKLKDNNVEEIRIATPEEQKNLIEYPMLSPEEINKKLEQTNYH